MKCFSFMVIIVAFILSGCSMHYTKDMVADLRQPTELYESFDTKPINLKAMSKCSYPPSIKIINAEKREDGIDMRPDEFHVHLPVNPKDLTDGIVDYLGSGFKKSRIDVNDNSPKVINISIKDLKGERGVWAQSGKITLQVEIPETKYVEIYSAKESTMIGPRAVVYAIHRATRQIIDDPVIQDYILCKGERSESINREREENATPESLSQSLQELQSVLDKGLITKEEYQFKRKAIIDKH